MILFKKMTDCLRPYRSFTVLIVLFTSGILLAQTKSVDEFIREADEYQTSNQLQKAVAVMNDAMTHYPNNVAAHAYCGLYTGMLAGETQEQDYMEAGRLVMECFQMLDKAISMDSSYVQAWLFRGIMGVNVPEFMGYLDQGIGDLNRILKTDQKSPQNLSEEERIIGFGHLATGYARKGQSAEAKAALENIIELAPESQAADQAKARLKRLGF